MAERCPNCDYGAIVADRCDAGCSPRVTDEMVERAAHALWDDDHRPTLGEPPIKPEDRDWAAMQQYRTYARLALDAALGEGGDQ